MQRQFVTFRLERSLFGIDVLLVDEINRQLDMVPVAGAPDFVRGLINLRGQIVSVIDLGTKLGLEPRTINRLSRCVVLKTTRMITHLKEEGLVTDTTCSDIVGLLVDRVEDMVIVDDTQIDPPPANVGQVAGEFISGVVQRSGDLLIILKLSEVVSHTLSKGD
jgi:purine-binding chemotaxis protein CheW